MREKWISDNFNKLKRDGVPGRESDWTNFIEEKSGGGGGGLTPAQVQALIDADQDAQDQQIADTYVTIDDFNTSQSAQDTIITGKADKTYVDNQDLLKVNKDGTNTLFTSFTGAIGDATLFNITNSNKIETITGAELKAYTGTGGGGSSATTMTSHEFNDNGTTTATITSTYMNVQDIMNTIDPNPTENLQENGVEILTTLPSHKIILQNNTPRKFLPPQGQMIFFLIFRFLRNGTSNKSITIRLKYAFNNVIFRVQKLTLTGETNFDYSFTLLKTVGGSIDLQGGVIAEISADANEVLNYYLTNATIFSYTNPWGTTVSTVDDINAHIDSLNIREEQRFEASKKKKNLDEKKKLNSFKHINNAEIITHGEGGEVL